MKDRTQLEIHKVAGNSLDALIQSQKYDSIEDLLLWLRPICRYLDKCQEQGLGGFVIRPKTIRLDETGKAQLISTASQQLKTESDARKVRNADLVALNGCTYEFLTARSGAVANSAGAAVEPLGNLRPDLSGGVCEIVDKIMRDRAAPFGSFMSYAVALYDANDFSLELTDEDQELLPDVAPAPIAPPTRPRRRRAFLSRRQGIALLILATLVSGLLCKDLVLNAGASFIQKVGNGLDANADLAASTTKSALASAELDAARQQLAEKASQLAALQTNFQNKLEGEILTRAALENQVEENAETLKILKADLSKTLLANDKLRQKLEQCASEVVDLQGKLDDKDLILSQAKDNEKSAKAGLEMAFAVSKEVSLYFLIENVTDQTIFCEVDAQKIDGTWRGYKEHKLGPGQKSRYKTDPGHVWVRVRYNRTQLIGSESDWKTINIHAQVFSAKGIIVNDDVDSLYRFRYAENRTEIELHDVLRNERER